MTTDTLVRKAHTGEPGNPGQFGHTQPKPDAEFELAVPPASMDDIFAEARATADLYGPTVKPTVSMLTSDGTAVSTSTLCVDCWTEDRARKLEFPSQHDWPGQQVWADSTDNEETRCYNCGAGFGRSDDEIVARAQELAGRYGYGSIAGYDLRGETYTPRRLLAEHYKVDVADLDENEVRDRAEAFLSEQAASLGIDRADEYTFDSDDFPKVVRFDDLDFDGEAHYLEFLFDDEA